MELLNNIVNLMANPLAELYVIMMGTYLIAKLVIKR